MNSSEKLIHNIEHEREAPPVEAHGYRVQPIARVKGWWGELPAQAAANAMGGGAFVQVTPVALQVEQAGQAPYRIALVDADPSPIKGILIGGLTIALVAGLINLLIRLRYG